MSTSNNSLDVQSENPIRKRTDIKMWQVNMRCLFLSGLALFTAGYYFMDVFVDFVIYEEQPLGNSSFVNSKGCRMSTFTPKERGLMSQSHYMWDEGCRSQLHLMSFSRDEKNYLGRELVPEILDSVLWAESFSNFKCKYQVVKRHSDYANRPLYIRKFSLMGEYVTIEPKADIIRAECIFNGSLIYNGVHFYIRPPDERLRSVLNLPALRSATDSNSLSVLIVGLDSISQLHFGRSMAQTANFLRSLPHVELKGFNRLERTGGLMSLLSGLSDTEIANVSSSPVGLDACPFIWKMFRKAGYETALGEDSIDKTMFPGRGFDEQPTDHYLRPALLEMWLKTRRDQSHGTHCNEKDNYAKVLRKFFFNIIPRHQKNRFFTFLWWTQGIDHLFNYARMLDTLFLELFHRAALSGLLKNTLILVVSNHGLNKGASYHTVQGKVEENLPLALLCYPKWMEVRFPRAIANLRANNHRLVTAYDLHATLLDMPDLTSIEDKSVEQRSFDLAAPGKDLPRGISLFLPVPNSRDCRAAQVPTKYCQCQEQEEVSTSEDYVLQAALLIVRHINRALHQHIPPCHKLSLKRVLAVDRWRRPADENQSELLVKLLATPGEGHFEGVVIYTGHELVLSGPILRTNDYGTESYCIDNYLINMYCFCAQMSKV